MFEVSKDDEVLIELTQKMLRMPGVDRETIGFTIMQVASSQLQCAAQNMHQLWNVIAQN